LGFGGALHEAIYQFLIGLVYRFRVDPIKAFDRYYYMRLDSNTEFPKKHTLESARDMGHRMIKAFMDNWHAQGLEVLFHEGKPMLEIYHRMDLGNDVVLVGKTDLIAYSNQHGITPIDFKSAAAFTEPWFANVAPQLSVYTLLFENFLKRGVDSVGFLEQKKNKTRGNEPHLTIVPRHADAQLEHIKEQIFWMAEDIRRERFPARVRMAWNSPCSSCSFREACHDGDYSLLREKKSRTFSKAA